MLHAHRTSPEDSTQAGLRFRCFQSKNHGCDDLRRLRRTGVVNRSGIWLLLVFGDAVKVCQMGSSLRRG